MADTTVTHGAPGIAEFNSQSYGNVKELRLQDTPPFAYRAVTITAGANLDLPIYSVVSLTGLALQSPADAVGVLMHPLVLANGQSATVHVLVQGHLDYEALNWDASFDTPAKKIAAFNGRPTPLAIILGTNPYTSDGVLA